MRWPAKRRIHPATKSASPMRHHVKIERTIPARMIGIPMPCITLFHGFVCSWSYCAMYFSNEGIVASVMGFIYAVRGMEARRQEARIRPLGRRFDWLAGGD